MPIDHAFSVDDFKTPVEFKDAKGIGMMLCRLILLEPGTFQDHPDMGVGLKSRFAHGPETTPSDIRREIESQIHKYLPNFTAARVRTDMDKNGQLLIAIDIDNTLFSLFFDTATKNVTQVSYKSLNDL